MDWNEYFAKAKKSTTLERMLLSKVEKMGIRYTPGRESLKLVAEFYMDSYPSAYQMLLAAYKREQELESAPAPEKSTKAVPPHAATDANAFQKGLEDEIQSWMAHHRKANA